MTVVYGNQAHTCTLYHRIDVGVDEKSADEKVRNASRSFRQNFDVPPTERLVSCMSVTKVSMLGSQYLVNELQ
jgi:hypothetical protein